MNTLYYFLQSIPESMGIISLSLALVRIPLKWGRIALVGLLLSISTYIIRALPVTFGLHLPISLLIIFLFIVKTTKVPASKTLMAIFVSFFILAAIEFLVGQVLTGLIGMDVEKAMANESLWTLIGVIQAVLLNVIATIIAIFRKPEEDVWAR